RRDRRLAHAAIVCRNPFVLKDQDPGFAPPSAARYPSAPARPGASPEELRKVRTLAHRLFRQQ
ncbi:MAG: hypothetical protein KDE27_28355, partial [Planctomycetes bacterium]|nr:hypothetical protein [Planctomycetota bacterium]